MSAPLIVAYTRPTPCRQTFHGELAAATPAAVAVLDDAIEAHQHAIVALADTRATLIRDLALECSVRGAADLLGVSPAAVSKAVARITDLINAGAAAVGAEVTGD